MSRSLPHVVITGGAGYIGSVLTRLLLEKGFPVTVIDNFMYRQASLLDCIAFGNLEVIRGDCRDEAELRKPLKSADIVIPLAALVGAPACERDSITARTTNVGAIQSLCKLLSPAQRLLFPVTNSGYGIGTPEKACTEESPLRPISLYGITKVQAEEEVLQRENSLTFRLATVFGLSPRMRLDLLVNNFVWQAVTSGSVVVFEGDFKRNYIHVRDVASVFLHGIEHFDTMKSRPYNVGLEDANLSKLELCEEIKKILPSFVYLESSIGEDVDKRDYIVSNQRILRTGFCPGWSLARGIAELVQGYVILQTPFHSNV